MAHIPALVLAILLPLTQTASAAEFKPMNRFKLASDLGPPPHPNAWLKISSAATATK